MFVCVWYETYKTVAKTLFQKKQSNYNQKNGKKLFKNNLHLSCEFCALASMHNTLVFMLFQCEIIIILLGELNKTCRFAVKSFYKSRPSVFSATYTIVEL